MSLFRIGSTCAVRAAQRRCYITKSDTLEVLLVPVNLLNIKFDNPWASLVRNSIKTADPSRYKLDSLLQEIETVFFLYGPSANYGFFYSVHRFVGPSTKL